MRHARESHVSSFLKEGASQNQPLQAKYWVCVDAKVYSGQACLAEPSAGMAGDMARPFVGLVLVGELHERPETSTGFYEDIPGKMDSGP